MFKSLRNKFTAADESIMLVSVTPSDCRSIAFHVLANLKKPFVLLDGVQVRNYTSAGPLTNERFDEASDFEIRDGGTAVLGFHSGPKNMWFNKKYESMAKQCEAQQWLAMGKVAAETAEPA